MDAPERKPLRLGKSDLGTVQWIATGTLALGIRQRSEVETMDEHRYGRTPRSRILALGLPPALMLIGLGGYWTLLSWGAFGGETSRSLGAVGPIVAGLGVALLWVCIRPRPYR